MTAWGRVALPHGGRAFVAGELNPQVMIDVGPKTTAQPADAPLARGQHLGNAAHESGADR